MDLKAADVLGPALRRPLPDDPIYKARLDEEYALIDRNGFTRVFLQVQRIMELCKELNIPHIIRGSAGSALICYLMGISHTDPIEYKMDLTRFMNHGRTDMPDIDIDIPYNRRDQLYERIGKEWPGKVARISNHVMYKYKSALQEAIRTHAPKIVYRKATPLEALVKDPELAAKIRQDMNEKMGTLRTESLHCGGIVIFDKEDQVPTDLILKDTGILPQIKLDKDETENAGFIKIDLLSNRGMAQWWDSSGGTRSLLDYPKCDDAVTRLFAIGDTIGITFGESRGQRNIYKRLRPTCIEDIAIALALIRPAAAIDGRKSAYLDGVRKGTLPKLDILKPIVYDDDALCRIRAALGPSNYSKNELDGMADRFRKAFAKQRLPDRAKFRDLCRAQTIPARIINQLMDDLDQLQHYSFCKSHALSYAQLVWALAYEKIYNPMEFWVASLNHCNSDYRRWVHWREARVAGLQLTRGASPYRLGKNKDNEPIMIPSKGEQSLLIRDDDPRQIYTDMKERGYWICKSFYPGCYKRVSTAPQRTLKRVKNNIVGMEEPEYIVHFCGLIATGRVVRCETDGDESMDTGGHTITFLTIGYDNGKLLDMVVQGEKGYLLGFAAVEGKARTRNPDSDDALEVLSIHGMPLHKLANVCDHRIIHKGRSK